jgi:alcohol dehydrogenase (cytochrome c)
LPKAPGLQIPIVAIHHHRHSRLPASFAPQSTVIGSVQLFASVLSTAGDLVFVGGTNDRMFRAFDARNGKLLWQQGTNSGIVGMPVAFQVGDTEYIAVVSGWGVDAQRQQVALSKTSLKLDANAVPQGGAIWVFALRHPGS